MNLLANIEQSIRARKLLSRSQKILVAVSGGLDSMVLLHVLYELSVKPKWKLTVAHFNHKLRGRSSDADEKFVQAAAKKANLKFISESADVRSFAKEGGLSIEMAGRQLRHDFFARAASKLSIRTVALAHHADDQVELFFLRLLRGAGSEGLTGMKWENPSPSDGKIKLVRPLLHQQKSALREFAKQHGINFREDATNVVMDFQRNRIRGELIPLLRQYQPALDKTILRVMEIIGAESELIGQLARGGTLPSAKFFDDLPVAVQRRHLQNELLSHGIAPDFDLIESLRASSQPISISRELSIFRDAAGQIVLRKNSTTGFDSNRKVLKLNGTAGKVGFGGAQISWKLVAKKVSPDGKHSANIENFDADKVGSKIFLRHWRSGDRFQPIGLGGAVKLQDLFTNAKIPRDERHRLIVATTARGEIFWVEKLRIGEQFKLCNGTLRVLKWHWQRH